MTTLSNILKRHKQSQIIKCRNAHIRALLDKAYVTAVELFPKNNLGRNLELTGITVSRILEVPYEKEVGEDDNKEIDEIHRSLISDEWAKKVIANYYRLEELLHSHEMGSDKLFSQGIEDCRKKAKSYYSVSQSISLNEVDSIDKNIKRDIKELGKNKKRIRSERIEAEKRKIIKPIHLSLSQILTLFSLLSILFLVGGYIYNRLLLATFGINSSDFFLLYDYISSGVDAIESSFRAAMIVAIIYLVRGYYYISEMLSDQQFNIDRNKTHFDRIYNYTYNHFHYVVIMLVSIPTLGIVMSLIRKQEFPDGIIDTFYMPIIVAGLYFILYKVPWNYMKNGFTASIITCALFAFLMDLAWTTRKDIRDIRNGEYESPYTISFEDGYKQYSKHMLLLSNSNYLFLVDEEGKEISVIPKSGVKAIFSKRNENHGWLLE